MHTHERALQRESDDPSYYGFEDAARLARISRRRLHRWVGLGVVTPTRRVIAVDGATLAQGFSLADVGYLHLLRHLRERGVSLEESAGHVGALMKRFGPPGPSWRQAHLTLVPRRSGSHQFVASVPDEWCDTVAIPGKQAANHKVWLEILDILPDDLSLESILIPPEFLPYVEIDPEREDGLPVVRGTSIRTAVVRELLDAMDVDEFCRDVYPHVPRKSAIASRDFERALDQAA